MITLSWHAFEINNVLTSLNSSTEGLTEEEAHKRLSQYGPNRLRPSKKRSSWSIFLSQFKNLLVYVLLVSAIITLITGHLVDAGVILGVIILNAVIGFIQEGKAENALDSIREMLTSQANIQRSGKRIMISSENLVPGDIVFLQSGDKVPADLRLINVKNLRIDESSLTGESLNAEKSMLPCNEKAAIGDRNCMAYSGTLLTYGQGRGIVVATGDSTEIGKINALLVLAPPMTTRLLLKMSEFTKTLTVVIGILSVTTLVFGVLIRGYSISDMFLAAVSLAVAAIPEGLPAILTITLAIGVQRMAKRNVIIRRLPSVETLGAVTVICSDKTGTLTKNEMTAKTVSTSMNDFEISGVGYETHGTFMTDGSEFSCYLLNKEKFSCDKYPDLIELARGSVLCNDASLIEVDDKKSVQGDPTEGALIVLGIKAGLDYKSEQSKFPRLDIIPFESEHRFMATLHGRQDSKRIIYLKGAPEQVLELCSYQRNSGNNIAINKNYWKNLINRIAGKGQRTLAIAVKEVTEAHSQLKFEDVQEGMCILGLVGIIDPPSGEATSAIQKCQTAGIRVKMITGDHVLTARAVGFEMGIGDGTTALSGHDLNNLKDDEIQRLVKEVDVYARVSPEHKMRLVKAIQANGDVVAMTGDGVNDAPALKQADIGIAMGRKGTEVAKEAAEMVLTDDNFASIEHAVEEGRTVYDNIKKAIMFILPTNAAEAGIIIVAIALGRMLPITPVQILWVNMITAVTLALSIAFEPPEEGVMKRVPRDPKESILSPFLIWRIGFVSLILIIGTCGLFFLQRDSGVSIEISRTVAVNTLVAFEAFYLLNTRYIQDSAFTKEGIFGNGYVVAAIGLIILMQALFTYFPPMQSLFGTANLNFMKWFQIIVVASSVFFIVELEKYVLRKHFKFF